MSNRYLRANSERNNEDKKQLRWLKQSSARANNSKNDSLNGVETSFMSVTKGRGNKTSGAADKPRQTNSPPSKLRRSSTERPDSSQKV